MSVITIVGKLACANNEGATALACAGLGVSVTATWGVARESLEGRLMRVLGDWRLPPVELHAVFPPGRATAAAARALVDQIAGAFRT